MRTRRAIHSVAALLLLAAIVPVTAHALDARLAWSERERLDWFLARSGLVQGALQVHVADLDRDRGAGGVGAEDPPGQDGDPEKRDGER